MIIRNKYEILDKIGEGGMACVYSARHLVFNEICAIKLVNDDLAADAGFLRRFETEALITRKLRHTNAVRVDDFDFAEDGRPFIVMELVEGRNLRDVIREEHSLAWKRAVGITRQIAEALAVAHKLGIVHRDIKPDNIVLIQDRNGQEKVKVLDFGIAKLRIAAEAQHTNLTMTGMLIGTPLYMSPEQFLGNKAAAGIDGRADLYALGVLLFQMLTGQPPFNSDTAYGLMLHHMQTPLQLPHEVRPELEIPKPISEVVLKAMEKDRARRYQTAEELTAALDEPVNWSSTACESAKPLSVVQEDFTDAGRQISNVAIKRQTLRKRISGNRAVIMVSGALLFALLLIGTYFVRTSVEQRRIENEIWTRLNSGSAGVLHGAIGLKIALHGHEVELDGQVPDNESSKQISTIAASVPGVVRVNNRLAVAGPSFTPVSQSAASADLPRLLATGTQLLDNGEYSQAIEHFQQAVSMDPNDTNARKMLDRAFQAKQAEEELLRSRR
jgi:serine/threonine protein kinase